MPKTLSEPRITAATITLHGPAMGTRWSVTLDDLPAAACVPLREEISATVLQVDQQMSPWKPDSDLTRLNRAPTGIWVDLPAEMLTVLARALEIALMSADAFDPTVGELVDAWGFGAARDAPEPAAIASARISKRGIRATQLEIDLPAGRACKHAPMQVDLCGIAKGYAVDRMAAVLQRHGVHHALAALDGELRAIGPQADGEPWAIALESPVPGRRTAHGVIELQNLAVATSGDYRRYWQIGATRVAHTMDPHKAAPLANALASVTVLATSCMDADAWATALLVSGPGEGLALARRLGLEVLLLMRRDGCITELGLGRFAAAASALDHY